MGDEYYIARLSDEVEPEHRFDQGSVDLFLPIPVIVDHRLEALKSASLESTLKSASCAVLFFERRNVLEQLDRSPLLLTGKRDEIIETIGGGSQAESAEPRTEIAIGHSLAFFSVELPNWPSRS
ncbi:MAG: hypothetical protein ABI488_06730 [Polyangiaceae bacterium]